MMIDGIEIERRFLVDGRAQKEWRGGDSISIFQCYLTGVSHIDGSIAWNGSTLVNDDREIVNISTWRIRRSGEKIVLAAKGYRSGATATEFEWPLSRELYDSLALDSLPCITKTRHLWFGEDGLLWEVDEFESDLAGLIIAEVELESEDQPVIIPDWTGLELTNLRGWSNASLSMMIKDAKQP